MGCTGRGNAREKDEGKDFLVREEDGCDGCGEAGLLRSRLSDRVSTDGGSVVLVVVVEG